MFRNQKIVIFTGFACIGGFVAYRYWKKRLLRTIDEGFDEVTKIDDSNEKRVVLLGLEGAGKTSVINQATAANSDNVYEISPMPTKGFAVHKLQKGAYNLDVWEIGGGEDTRRYWSNFLLDTDLLVFMVDAADTKKLPSAILLLKELMGEPQVDGKTTMPILVLANKQDLPNALKAEEVKEAMDLRSAPTCKHEIQVLGCQTRPLPSDLESGVTCNWYHPSIVNVLDKIISMSVASKVH